MTRRITVVTSGHPSSCPRMVKAADAAHDAGFAVRLVSVDFADWAASLDAGVVSRRNWEWSRVRLRGAEHPLRSRWVSARQRTARALAATMSPQRAWLQLAITAYARTHAELVNAILAAPFDLVYGGTVGALAATAEAARRANRPFGLDLEDYHLDESEEADAGLTHALAGRVVRTSLCGARFVTTASVPMAQRYERDCGVSPHVIHNVVPRPAAPLHREVPRGPLQLYWFSQTVGPGRGLEEIVAAVAAAGIEAALHLRGSRGEDFVQALRRDARDTGAHLSITLHPPAAADDMVALCREHMIGLALEQGAVVNRDVCVTNKVLTYLAAGMAVIATATSGHRFVADHAPAALACYPAGDIAALALMLRRWDSNREELARARAASWHAAETRFHWEHPRERGALLQAFEGALR